MPKIFKEFSTVRIDDYGCLRDHSHPRVTTYLDPEIAYTDKLLEQMKPLVDEIATELKERARPKM
jgi:protease II